MTLDGMEQCGDPQDQGNIANIAAYHIAHSNHALGFNRRDNADYQLRGGGAEGHHRQADHNRRDPQAAG